MMPLIAFSQTKTVRGTVTDTQGEPIPGASITISGTQRGTLTDIDGKFNIEASANNKLIVSFIGYIKKEVPVDNNTDFTITLQENLTELDDVVVVGYGTQKRATLTGSVSSVASKEITVTKNENVVNMLAGKLPGLRVTQTSSRPGAFESKFDIRGLGSPLIIIDITDKSTAAKEMPTAILNIFIVLSSMDFLLILAFSARSASGSPEGQFTPKAYPEG